MVGARGHRCLHQSGSDRGGEALMGFEFTLKAQRARSVAKLHAGREITEIKKPGFYLSRQKARVPLD